MLPIWKSSQFWKKGNGGVISSTGPAFTLAVVGGPVTKHPSLGDFKLQKLSRHVLSWPPKTKPTHVFPIFQQRSPSHVSRWVVAFSAPALPTLVWLNKRTLLASPGRQIYLKPQPAHTHASSHGYHLRVAPKVHDHPRRPFILACSL